MSGCGDSTRYVNTKETMESRTEFGLRVDCFVILRDDESVTDLGLGFQDIVVDVENGTRVRCNQPIVNTHHISFGSVHAGYVLVVADTRQVALFHCSCSVSEMPRLHEDVALRLVLSNILFLFFHVLRCGFFRLGLRILLFLQKFRRPNMKGNIQAT